MVDMSAVFAPAMAARHGFMNRYHVFRQCSSFVLPTSCRAREHFLAQKPCMMAQTMISSAVPPQPNLHVTIFRATSGYSFAWFELP
ncbi:MAG: hypothetical protein EWM45_17270 [Rhodopseudomonas palustris]|uniref:hypothetical protein n=1 Tax=Rhodopseudomonas faecalis TaxID=99655 RepID=UPI0011B81A43|nr:hypothetical protein [Rhodopseudomonas faecalis]TAH64827.1 MAG: hypothetical protein EWM45_17270 [Rhodopseudomonas palustris]